MIDQRGLAASGGVMEMDIGRNDHSLKPDTLLVVVHGLRGSQDQLKSVIDAAKTALGPIDVYAPPMPYGRNLFTRARPFEILGGLLDEIDRRWAKQVARTGEGYRRIILVGHSVGGLVLRKVAVIAHGESDAAPFEDGYERFREPRPWAHRISRLVMLAGMAKGWSLTSASKASESFRWRVGILLGTLLGAGKGIVMETRRGLPFVSQTRLQWLALMGRPAPPSLDVVQILGTRDDVVSPNDMIDLAVDARDDEEPGFVLLEMPETDHAGIIKMSDPATNHAGPEAVRWTIFCRALCETMPSLQRDKYRIPPSLLSDGELAKPDSGVTDVVFVIHGIRDRGFWTQKVARKIKEEVEKSSGRKMRSMTMSYGYLAMLPFVWVGVRRAKTAWLMDQYVAYRSLYPEAQFHYVGHSNGTYLAARALQDYPAARFQRIVFAGSVVRCGYDWKRLMRPPRKQVDALLNYVATRDIVVAALPSGLGLFDLGGAGNSGFDQFPPPTRHGTTSIAEEKFGASPSFQLNYVRGGHGAGVKESQWDDIARFIVHGARPSAGDQDYCGQQSFAMHVIARLSAIGLVPFAIVIIVAVSAILVFAPHLGVLIILLLLLFLTRF
jgi:pimeloyl-ACP methyl ester carboxylesterase